MADATFKKGEYKTRKHTAGADITAGDVVTVGSVTANTGGDGAIACIAHHDIANAAVGTLAIGGGIYEVVNRNNAADGAKVWWDGTDKVTTTSTNNAVFGFITENGAGGTNSTCLALHWPFP